MSGASFELSVNGSFEKAAEVLEVEAPYVHEGFTLYRCATRQSPSSLSKHAGDAVTLFIGIIPHHLLY